MLHDVARTGKSCRSWAMLEERPAKLQGKLAKRIWRIDDLKCRSRGRVVATETIGHVFVKYPIAGWQPLQSR